MEIFCYGDKSHIRVHPHIKYFLGAAKTVVTGGKNVIFWIFRATQLNSTQLNFILQEIVQTVRIKLTTSYTVLAGTPNKGV